MQIRQENRLPLLSEREIICLATALRENSYWLTTERPLSGMTPTGIHPRLQNDDSFQYILDDLFAHVNTYSINIHTDPDTVLNIPIGVYGVSAYHGIRMPIIIGDFVTNYIKINESALSEIVGENIESLKGQYQGIKQSKENLIRNIFGFYRDLATHNSIMVWEIRDESSFTRTCATGENFQRSVSQELNREFYHAHNLTGDTFNHVVGAAGRLISVVNKPIEQPATNGVSSMDVISLFCKTLISI